MIDRSSTFEFPSLAPLEEGEKAYSAKEAHTYEFKAKDAKEASDVELVTS